MSSVRRHLRKHWGNRKAVKTAIRAALAREVAIEALYRRLEAECPPGCRFGHDPR